MLPVCHGTSDMVLQTSVGHLEWTSLPVGGESTHSVLTGHRGLPSAELLTNIDQLEYGDVFYIHVLGQTLEYQVDQILVVEPDQVSSMVITEGEDYVTLLTCTPYGINSHRLLVRGARVADEEETERVTVDSETTQVDLTLIVMLGTAVVVVVVFAILLDRAKRAAKPKGGKWLSGKKNQKR